MSEQMQLMCWIAIGVVLAVVAFRGFKAFAKPNLAQLIDTARQCRSSGQYVEAAVLLRKARAVHPNSAEASREYIGLLFETKRYSEADRHVHQHFERWPDDTVVREMAAAPRA